MISRIKPNMSAWWNTSTQFTLEDYIGAYDPREVLVLTDSGYDNKKIENAIADKRWNFIIALGKTRSVKSEALYSDHPQVSTVVPHCHVFPQSSQAQVENHSSRDEWDQSASEWTFASDTPSGICATWARSSWCVQNFANDRMVAASILPAMI